MLAVWFYRNDRKEKGTFIIEHSFNTLKRLVNSKLNFKAEYFLLVNHFLIKIIVHFYVVNMLISPLSDLSAMSDKNNFQAHCYLRLRAAVIYYTKTRNDAANCKRAYLKFCVSMYISDNPKLVILVLKYTSKTVLTYLSYLTNLCRVIIIIMLK